MLRIRSQTREAQGPRRRERRLAKTWGGQRPPSGRASGEKYIARWRNSAMDPAESGYAQSSDMGPGQRGLAAALISGGSSHWQGPSNLDSERRSQQLPMSME